MGNLKNAYDLANERIIVSRYMPKKNDDIEFDNMGRIPDFVESYKVNDVKAGRYDFCMIEERGTKSLLEEFDKSNVQNENNIKQEDDVKMQSSITVNFNNEILNVEICGDFYSYSGIGRLSRAVAFGLSKNDIKTKIISKSKCCDVNKNTESELNILKNMEVNSPIKIQISDSICEKLICDILFLLKTNLLSDSDINNINNSEIIEIWVPSQFSKHNLLMRGVMKSIYVINVGVDSNRYKSQSSKVNFNIELNNFVYLTRINWEENYGSLLKAYLEEFSSIDNTTLLIHVTKNDNKINELCETVQEIKKTVNKSEEEFPHMVLYDKIIPENHMPSFYNLSNVFVRVSRNEDCGFSFLESFSCAIPIIASNHGGHVDYLPESSCIIDINNVIYSQIMFHMRQAHYDYPTIKNKAIKDANAICGYGWDKMTYNILKRLEHIQQKRRRSI